jgi:glycosyltransferase involved in cell wall biosynthesis
VAKPRVLLLSAYDGPSHRYWREQLVQQLAEFDWTVLTLPPRHFSWRIRGNALSLAYSQQALLQQPFDRVVVTSMVDIATLRGLVPSLARVPTLWYCHENQFAYPQTEHAHASIEPQMVLMYGALACERLAFNSAYNRDTFLQGVDALLRKMPDAVPAGIVEMLREKSEVVPVPLQEAAFHQRVARKTADDPLWVVWNHRWEHDKGPERLLALVQKLAREASDVSIIWSIVGPQFRRRPPEFAVLEACIGNQPRWQLKNFGFCDENEYRELLRGADIVLSTARHDFQGLAVLEAVAAGCTPCVPDRLAYREFIDEGFRYDSGDDIEAEASAAANMLLQWAELRRRGQALPQCNVDCLMWMQLAAAYRHMLPSSLR